MSVHDGLALKGNGKTPANYSKLLMSAGSSLKGFTTGSLEYDSYIVDSSKRYNIDPLLIYAQMHQESSFKLKAHPTKALGLMQLMPAKRARRSALRIYNPRRISKGQPYSAGCLTFNGDVVYSLRL